MWTCLTGVNRINYRWTTDLEQVRTSAKQEGPFQIEPTIYTFQSTWHEPQIMGNSNHSVIDLGGFYRRADLDYGDKDSCAKTSSHGCLEQDIMTNLEDKSRRLQSTCQSRQLHSDHGQFGKAFHTSSRKPTCSPWQRPVTPIWPIHNTNVLEIGGLNQV